MAKAILGFSIGFLLAVWGGAQAMGEYRTEYEKEKEVLCQQYVEEAKTKPIGKLTAAEKICLEFIEDK